MVADSERGRSKNDVLNELDILEKTSSSCQCIVPDEGGPGGRREERKREAITIGIRCM